MLRDHFKIVSGSKGNILNFFVQTLLEIKKNRKYVKIYLKLSFVYIKYCIFELDMSVTYLHIFQLHRCFIFHFFHNI